MKKINHATPEQWEKIEEIRQWWIDRQAAELDDAAATSAVEKLWARMGLKKPLVLFVDSPAASKIAGQMLSSPSQRSQLRNELMNELRNELTNELWNELGNELMNELMNELWNELTNELWNELGNELRRNELGKELMNELNDPKVEGYMSHWLMSWAAVFEAGTLLGADLDREMSGTLIAWCRHIHYCVPCSGVCIVSRNPEVIEWEDGRLHCEDGPAVRYSDGFAVHSIRGVRVPEKVVMAPETQTIEEIREERNAEVKRLRIERYGWAKYLRETNAKKLHGRQNDIEGTWEFLYQADDHRVLLCACPSSAKEFALEVADWCTTCQEAQAYLSGGLSARIISAS